MIGTVSTKAHPNAAVIGCRIAKAIYVTVESCAERWKFIESIFLHFLGQTSQAWSDIAGHLPELDAECVDLFTVEANYSDVFAYIEKAFSATTDKIRLCEMSLGTVFVLKRDYVIEICYAYLDFKYSILSMFIRYRRVLIPYRDLEKVTIQNLFP